MEKKSVLLEKERKKKIRHKKEKMMKGPITS